MTSERIQLHSPTGRLLLLIWTILPLLGLSGTVTAAVVLSVRQGAVHLPIASLIFAVPALLLARWARRNSTTVFASAQGLELPKLKRTIPWPAVVNARLVPFVGGLVISVHRITFNDGTPPLTFYSHGDAERIVQRFKTGADGCSD
jgi:hypothetical protein